MGLSESLGGSGASPLAAALVSEAHARRLAALPFIEHFVATRLMARCLPDDSAIASLAGSNGIGTLALHPALGRHTRLVPAGAVSPTDTSRGRSPSV